VGRILSSGWSWIPSLYFAQGLPYVVAMTVSVVMYKTLGMSNTDIALYTSWLYLPWVIKPLWSPIVEVYGTKRRWVVFMQFIIGAALALVALTLPTTHFFQLSIAVLWLLAFASATHDIAADGFYLLALETHRQAAFVGVRSAFYRVASVTGQGVLVFIAGELADFTGDTAFAWSMVFAISGGLFVVLVAWHQWVLPRPAADRPTGDPRHPLKEFLSTFEAYFRRPDIVSILAFLLLFRFAEAQALKLVTPFLLDPKSSGGLGLTTAQVGIAYGTIGIVALTAGGLLGGVAIARNGLDRWMWPMTFAVHMPNLVFVYLALAQPDNFLLIAVALAIEQFGYGFGFSAYLMFMMWVAEGRWRTAHYAICTGFMALGMMLPGMFSGQIQETVGYQHFFLWVMLSTIPGFLVAALVRIPPEFGKKRAVRQAAPVEATPEA